MAEHLTERKIGRFLSVIFVFSQRMKPDQLKQIICYIGTNIKRFKKVRVLTYINHFTAKTTHFVFPNISFQHARFQRVVF